ncbi:MAG: OmpA family protein [Bacteroidota bacterium]
MKNIINILFVFALGISVLSAQDRATKKADKHFERLEFVDAAEKYEKIVEKGDADDHIYRRLAESHYYLYNTKKAERFYKLVVKNNDNVQAEDYFRYAQMLKANAKVDESNEAMDKFAEMAPNDMRAQFYKQNPTYVEDLKAKEPSYGVEKMELSSEEYSDFGGYEHDGMLYFVSARNKSRKTYGWNDQPVLDIFVAENVAGTFENEEGIEGDVNSKFNEGTMAISNDGETIYFTRNNYNGKYEANEEGVGQLRLFKATLIDGRWKDVEPLDFTDAEHSYSHPALSPDNKTLYFSSDMPGGFGQSDIYKVAINEDGTFGEPENLGEAINTPGRESFPFMDDAEKLYFSSDGHLGLGGLDIFFTEWSNGEYKYPKNLGKPVNSKADDFAFTYFDGKESGYVSSNRDGMGTVDNIYQVELLKPIDETLLTVRVTDADNNKVLEGVEVLVYDEDENEVGRANTKEDGIAKILVLSNMDYDVQANKRKFESNSVNVTAEGEEMPVNIELDPIKLIRERTVVLENIFFEFDKAEIKSTAALELDKLIEVLKEYEDIRLKVESHTDRRGPAEYNKTLSEKRAKNTVDYMVSKGIDESRLEYEGLGESQPLVDCGSNCTEEDHRKNRRSEFSIIEKSNEYKTTIERPEISKKD